MTCVLPSAQQPFTDPMVALSRWMNTSGLKVAGREAKNWDTKQMENDNHTLW